MFSCFNYELHKCSGEQRANVLTDIRADLSTLVEVIVDIKHVRTDNAISAEEVGIYKKKAMN